MQEEDNGVDGPDGCALDVCLEDKDASTDGASCAMAEQISLPLIGLANGMVLSQSAGWARSGGHRPTERCQSMVKW